MVRALDKAYEIVVKAIASQFGVLPSSVTRATVAADISGWDSFAHAQLVMAIEAQIGLPLPLNEMMAAQHVGDLVDIVSQLFS